MNETAKTVFEYLKGKGKVSGGHLRADLGLGRGAWNNAKIELKELGLVQLGRGRGGTIELISEDIPKEPKKVTQQERMAFAREEKAARTSTKRELEDIKKKVEAFVRGQFPKDTKFWVEVHPATKDAIIYVWGVWENNEEYWKPYKYTFNKK